jgi:phage terminase Nu1 subunit (DNA packaging protein)
MARPKKEIRDFRSEIISAPEAAMLLGLPERSFRQLVEDGALPKNARGEYILGDIWEAYWKYRLGSCGLEAEQTRLTKVKADLAELDLAEQREEVLRASAVMRVWADDVMNAKTRLLAIPTKYAPDLAGRSVQEIHAKLKAAINEALEEIAEYDGRRIARASASFRE